MPTSQPWRLTWVGSCSLQNAVEELLVGDLARVEVDLDRLGVAGAAAADLLVGRVVGRGRRCSRRGTSLTPACSGTSTSTPQKQPAANVAFSAWASCALQFERAGVDAVALPGRAGAVREDVAEMAAAGGAHHLGAHHAVARVGLGDRRSRGRRLDEARPAGAGVELRVGAEELGAAAGAAVDAGVLRVDVLAGERALGALPPEDLVLLRASAPRATRRLSSGFVSPCAQRSRAPLRAVKRSGRTNAGDRDEVRCRGARSRRGGRSRGSRRRPAAGSGRLRRVGRPRRACRARRRRQTSAAGAIADLEELRHRRRRRPSRARDRRAPSSQRRRVDPGEVEHEPGRGARPDDDQDRVRESRRRRRAARTACTCRRSGAGSPSGRAAASRRAPAADRHVTRW